MPDIPFFAPSVQLGDLHADLAPGQRFEEVAQQLASGPVRVRAVRLECAGPTWRRVAEFEAG